MRRCFLAVLLSLCLAVTLASPIAALPGEVTDVESGTLSSPFGVAVDLAGNIYIADTLNSRVQRIDGADGNITTVAAGTLDRPQAVAVDSAGNVYIADTFNNRIQRVAISDGAVTTVASGTVTSPRGLAVATNGDLYISDGLGGRVQRVAASDGAVTTVASGIAVPFGLSFDLEGNLFIAATNNNQIWRVAASDGGVTAVAGGSLGQPSGVVVDADGNLFISDTNNNRIQRVAASDGVITTVASGLGTPRTIALGNSGDLIVVNSAPSSVSRIESFDASRPEISVSSPLNNKAFANGTSLVARYSCNDSGGSGLVSCGGVLDGVAIADGDVIPAVSGGSRTLIVTATDKAGNTSEVAVPFTIDGPREITGSYAGALGNNGSVARLYMATFKRQPDVQGQTYWVGRSSSDLTLIEVAQYFVESPEFVGTYADLTNVQFANLLYTNVMNRAGEASGVAFWANRLDQGASRASVLLYFSESSEFKALTKTS